MDTLSEKILSSAKSFIKDLKDLDMKNKLAKHQKAKSDAIQQEIVTKFQLGELQRGITELESNFKCYVGGAEDREISKWNEEIPDNLKRLE